MKPREGVEEGTVWDGGGHRYQLEHVVGNGAFGIVWRARSAEGETVAIKKVLLDRRYHNRELQMMKVMEHENVVRLRHYFEKAGRKKDETFLHLDPKVKGGDAKSQPGQGAKGRVPFRDIIVFVIGGGSYTEYQTLQVTLSPAGVS